MTLDEMLALLPDNSTGAIDAADLRAIVTELHALASTLGQASPYLWTTSAGPGSGKVTGPWALGPGTLQISETSGDGASHNFELIDSASSAEIRLLVTGSALRATVTGASVDQGGYRDLPVEVVGVAGPAPSMNAKTNVVVTVALP